MEHSALSVCFLIFKSLYLPFFNPMRKIILLAFIAMLTFVSCSTGKQNKAFRIGVSQCSDDAWRRTMNEDILREASFYSGLSVNIKTAYDSNQKQIRDIESFIADRVDLIIVSPNEAIPLTPVIEKAMGEGIPVILVDRKISSGNYTAFVGADNYQIGKEVGIYAANLLNGKGNIVEIRGLEGSTPEKERHEGFISIIKEYKGIRIVHDAFGNWLRKDAKEKMQEILKLPTSIDLIFGHNDEMAIGAYEAFKVHSDVKPPLMIGIDALSTSDGGIQQVLNGVLDATFIYPTGGEKAIQTAFNILNNKVFEKENILYTAVIDKTNARVIKLQTDQIHQHQNRIGQLNEVLDKNLAEYTSQRVILFASFVILALSLALILLLIRTISHKNRTNKLLESQNIAINNQKEAISEQRDQLIALSKNLEDATQAKLVFFTNISHEFRTPLTLLLGPLENIVKNEKLSEEGSRLTLLMRKNVQVLMKLIDQITEFRRYENGKMQMYFTLSDLNVFIKDIYDSFFELSKKKHIHFNFSVEKGDFIVWFDSDKMEKICYNLLSNAFKFTAENGHINIHLSKMLKDNEWHAKIIVSDDGRGMSEQHLDQIFNRFYKIDRTSAGSGIGLELTKILVEQHNGTIEVESTEGKGSIFVVTIPFKQNDIAVTETYPVLNSSFEEKKEEISMLESDMDIPEEEKNRTSRPLVLIVDDNTDIRIFLRSLLQEQFEVIEADNGQSAFYKAMKYVPELIISDVMMDVMDGFELCAQIKENISTSHIPVMLLTACVQDEQRAVGFESGADAYIPKPFNEELLKIRVRKIIENREKVKAYFQQNLTFGERKESVAEIDKSFIAKFRKIVEENLIETDLNVDDIGQRIGLSRVQLYRKIKSLTNYAPNELIRIIRLKTAEQSMLNTEKSISEIAYDTGFSSPSYFTKCFKEYFNESPTEYTKRVKS
jgi:ABC-type sugar transport system substrate-binding protein/CheY-like chemotaxis protein/AraC-like DNA-binding protein/nitrogen-specific signal transduction histidine kinase